jgi:sialic acid synthase SpsE
LTVHETEALQHVFLIADVGSNFDGDLDVAKRYVAAAKEAGADAVKFQTIQKRKLIAPRTRVQGQLVDNPAYAAFGNLELPDEWHYELKRTADESGIEFISTPFYLEAVGLLEDVGVTRYKIASSDITFRPLLEAVGKTGKPVILSTGASYLSEVEQAVDVLKSSGAKDISLLHCVCSYPPKWSEMNLRAVPAMLGHFGIPVGISDHTPGFVVPIAAVAMGATIVEKHVTFDRSLPGPDHALAMTLEEFHHMALQIRLVEEALGTGDKVPTPSEVARLHLIRRGIYDPETLEPMVKSEGLWLRPAPRDS